MGYKTKNSIKFRILPFFFASAKNSYASAIVLNFSVESLPGLTSGWYLLARILSLEGFEVKAFDLNPETLKKCNDIVN